MSDVDIGTFADDNTPYMSGLVRNGMQSHAHLAYLVPLFSITGLLDVDYHTRDTCQEQDLTCKKLSAFLIKFLDFHILPIMIYTWYEMTRIGYFANVLWDHCCL